MNHNDAHQRSLTPMTRKPFVMVKINSPPRVRLKSSQVGLHNTVASKSRHVTRRKSLMNYPKQYFLPNQFRSLDTTNKHTEARAQHTNKGFRGNRMIAVCFHSDNALVGGPGVSSSSQHGRHPTCNLTLCRLRAGVHADRD